MKKAMIGIVPLYDSEKESYWMLPGYMKAIEKVGGIPVMLPLTSDQETIISIANHFDGFLFTGGQDVNPEIYKEKVEDFCGNLCLERDSMEQILFKNIIKLDKPALGICRGIQLFNVLLGGTLYQDIPLQFQGETKIVHKQNPPYDQPIHKVWIKKESSLYEIVKRESLMVNSYHHQGIKDLSSELKCAGQSEDGLIEAVYMPNKKFVLAVQWHPEFNYLGDRSSLKLFQAFVQSVKNL